MFVRKIVLLLPAIVLGCCGQTFAQNDFPIIRLVLTEGEVIPGVGAIDTIGDVAINDSGETLITVNTDNPDTGTDEVLLRNGQVFLQEGIVGQLNSPPGAFIAGAEPLPFTNGVFNSLNINNAGTGAYFLSIEDFPSSMDHGVYVGADLVIQQGQVTTLTDFTPGTTYDFLFALKQNNNGTLLYSGLADDPNIEGNLDNFLATFDGTTESLIAVRGDMLPGSNLPLLTIGTQDNLSAINDNGDVMFVANFGDDTDAAIYLNDTLLAYEGDPSPVPGRDWGPLRVSGLDLNNSGDYVFKGILDGSGLSGDQLIIKNGDVVMAEGETAPDGFPVQNFGQLSGPIEIGNNGKVIYQVRSTNDTTFLYLDNELLVFEGVTTTENGTTIEDITSLVDTFDSSEVLDLSADGRWAIFEGRIADGNGQLLNAIFTIQFEEEQGAFVTPASFDLFRGIEVSASLSDFINSDDVRAQFNPGFTINNSEAPVWLIFDANTPAATEFLVESQAGTPGLTYTVEAWNFDTNAYDVIGIDSESFNSDSTGSYGLTAQHVDTNGDVRSRVGWRQTGFTINFPWEVRVDQVGWNP